MLMCRELFDFNWRTAPGENMLFLAFLSWRVLLLLLLLLLWLSFSEANSSSESSTPIDEGTEQAEALHLWPSTRHGHETSSEFLLKDADLLLGVSIPIRLPAPRNASGRGDGGGGGRTSCGRVSENGLQTLEAVLYALDYVNHSQLLAAHNVTLGAIVLDDCDNNFQGIENALAFSYARLVNASCSCGGDSDAVRTQGKVVGVVGSSMSEVSIAMAGLLAASHMPQVRARVEW